jgi:hypothetical protein
MGSLLDELKQLQDDIKISKIEKSEEDKKIDENLKNIDIILNHNKHLKRPSDNILVNNLTTTCDSLKVINERLKLINNDLDNLKANQK